MLCCNVVNCTTLVAKNYIGNGYVATFVFDIQCIIVLPVVLKMSNNNTQACDRTPLKSPIVKN